MVMAPATGGPAEWVLVRPLRPPRAGDTHPTHTRQYERTLLAPHDPPPPVGVQLVRPRRCAAAGADSANLPGEGLPQGTLRALVLRGLNGDGVPGGRPGGLTPQGLSSREDCLSARCSASGGPGGLAARCALFPFARTLCRQTKAGRVMCWEQGSTGQKNSTWWRLAAPARESSRYCGWSTARRRWPP